jgi:hypothetical protein
MSMLARATEATEAPTPGYLYMDLAKQATANPVACQEMSAYLIKRLQTKNNPNVKFKCCKVIAKLAEAVPHFRRVVALNPSAVAAIKEAGHFRGTMDPVRGDQPNQKVRDAAKEALECVYRETPSSQQQASSNSLSSSYAPSPNSSSGGGGGGGYPGTRRMDSVGNPHYPDPRLQQQQQPTNFNEVVREAKVVIAGMIKDPLARNIDVPAHVPRQGHSGDLPGYHRAQPQAQVGAVVFFDSGYICLQSCSRLNIFH